MGSIIGQIMMINSIFSICEHMQLILYLNACRYMFLQMDVTKGTW